MTPKRCVQKWLNLPVDNAAISCPFERLPKKYYEKYPCEICMKIFPDIRIHSLRGFPCPCTVYKIKQVIEKARSFVDG